jgi:acetylornithine deacetylase/succinyl-diaminopimelate desuccinylase-like protein
MVRVRVWFAVMGCAVLLSAAVQAEDRQKTDQEARAILKQLIEINTTDSIGNVSQAAEAMAQRLRAAGFAEKDVTVAGPNERKKNLVVRYRGTGQKKPILGPPIHSSSLKKTDTSTAGARRT